MEIRVVVVVVRIAVQDRCVPKDGIDQIITKERERQENILLGIGREQRGIYIYIYIYKRM